MIKPIASFVAAALAITGFAQAAHAQALPSPYTNATRYDAMGRVTGTISADPDGVGSGNPFIATRTTYDPAGRPTKVESGYLDGWQSHDVAPASWAGFHAARIVESTYDAQGARLTERVRGWNGTAWATYSLTQFSYDPAGRLECKAVRMNPATYDSLPANACSQPATTGSDGPDRITRSVYDAAGQLAQVRESVGTSDDGLAIDTTKNGVAEVTYGYTRNGKIEYVVDAGGHKALQCYDGHDRQVRWVFPSIANPGAFNDATAELALSTAGVVNGACTGGAGDYEEYAYDTNGNRTSLRKRDGYVLGYSYDALGRLTVKTVPDGGALSGSTTRDVYYGYDLRGLQTFARFDSSAGEGVSNVYDGFGRLVAATTTMGGTSRTLGYGYYADGTRWWITHPDGAIWTSTYDGLGRAAYRFEYASATAPFTTLNLDTYDAQGRLATRRFGQLGYGYDGASRLISHQVDVTGTTGDFTTTFAYNPASQIASRTRTNDAYAFPHDLTIERGYTSNGLNQYTAAGPASFTYDANGNLTSDGTTSYVYDRENRLVWASSGAALTYDPLGRLVEVWGGPAGIQQFLYDGDALVAEYGATGAMLRRYVHGAADGVDDPLLWYEGASVGAATRRYLNPDHQGSIVLVLDAWSQPFALNSYDEYGIPAATNQGRFQYTGQAWIPEVGLYYYKARMYSPTLGRFMQTDPIGYDDQFNLYAYVRNDPINRADPMGTQDEYKLTIPGLDGETTITSSDSGVTIKVETPLYLGQFTIGDGRVSGEITSAGETVSGSLTKSAASAEIYRGSTLARNMERSGNPVSKGVERAHHLVAQAALAATPARDVLKRVGIDIHSADNGAAVKVKIHAPAHTNEYYGRVNEVIQRAERGGRAAVREALSDIRRWFR